MNPRGHIKRRKNNEVSSMYPPHRLQSTIKVRETRTQQTRYTGTRGTPDMVQYLTGLPPLSNHHPRVLHGMPKLWKVGETMSLNRSPKPPNAVCAWCDNRDPPTKWCFSYQKNITPDELLKPRRCPRYKGEVLTDDNFKSARELHNAGRRVS